MSPIVPIPLPYPPEVMRFQPTGRRFTGQILLPVVTHPSGTTKAYTGSITLPAHVKHTYALSSSITVSASSGFGTTNSISHGVSSRDPGLWPFAATSPWNYPIGSNAVYAPLVAADGAITSSYINNERYSVWIWQAATNDPVYTLTATHVSSLGFLNPWHTNQFSRHVPANYQAGTGEGWICVITPDHLTSYEGNACSPSNGPGPFSTYDTVVGYDLKGPGHKGDSPIKDAIWYNTGDEATPTPADSPGWPFSSGTAFDSMGCLKTICIPFSAGVIRSGELTNGIFHALSFAASPFSWNQARFGLRSFVWPATNGDGQGTLGSGGNLYQGGLVALLPSFDNTQLTNPKAQVIATALKNYGAIGCGSGGVNANSIVFYMDGVAVHAGEVPTGASWDADMTLIGAHLQAVTNSFNSSGGKPSGIKLDGGDGNLRGIPLAPPFDR